MKILGREIGRRFPCYVIAEIGINHNGDVSQACRLVEAAAMAGAEAVKFQKRTPRICWPESKWSESPKWPQSGCRTEGEWKERLELDDQGWRQIIRRCREWDIAYGWSCWDVEAVAYVEQFDPAFHKIASPCLTDNELLQAVDGTARPVIMSTGMSDFEQVAYAFEQFRNSDVALLQCTSAYPCENKDLNLRAIHELEAFNCAVGYSGHERGLATSVAAVAMGAAILERHLTLDRSQWGSDHASSLEPPGFNRLVRDVRAVETAMGSGIKRCRECELGARAKLRRVTGDA